MFIVNIEDFSADFYSLYSGVLFILQIKFFSLYIKGYMNWNIVPRFESIPFGSLYSYLNEMMKA